MAAALVVVGMPAASAADLTNPAPLIDAFRTTCLADFPNVDAIARNAIAAGWIERKVTLLGPPAKGMSATSLPRFFEWRGLNMSVVRTGNGNLVSSCQVSSPSADTLDTTALAAATSVELKLGDAVRGKKGGSDLAQWRRAPGQLIQASAGKNGAMRSVNLLVRLEAEVPPKINLLAGR
jgi:hypothetical protein